MGVDHQSHCQIIWAKEGFIILQNQPVVGLSSFATFLFLLFAWTFFIFSAERLHSSGLRLFRWPRVYKSQSFAPMPHNQLLNSVCNMFQHFKQIYAGLGVSSLMVTLAILLLLQPVDARWTRRPRRTTTPRSTTSITTANPDRHQHVHHWPPLVAPPPQPQPQPPVVVVQKPSHTETSPRLVDSFDQRSLDGQYEFR